MRPKFQFSRRSFLKQIGVATIAAPFFTRNLISAPPSSLLQHASFGATGMAEQDIGALTSHPSLRLIAVAEVDTERSVAVKKKFPNVKVYQDWRRMLDEEKGIDSVNVSVPDHMHAAMGMSAMQRGHHVYGQKPLTHDLYETRRLTQFAREKKLVTQMGIQIHALAEYRQAVRLIQDLAIGKVREVHTWSNKKWGDPDPIPQRVDPVPANFNWDLWLGVCAERPYIGDGYYHPGNWRKRLDFGTGTFGDMGCHIYDPVFEALGLTAPISVRSEGPAPTPTNWGINSVIKYVFPGTRVSEDKTVRVTWYDGDALPPKEVQALIGGEKLPDQGSIFIGTKGVMLLPHIGAPRLFPEADFDSYTMPKIGSNNHWGQFVDACLGKGKTLAGFDYSGPLTEAVLLGSVACRFPQTTLEWNAADLKFPNVPEANKFVRRQYRKGWEVKGLE